MTLERFLAVTIVVAVVACVVLVWTLIALLIFSPGHLVPLP